MNGDFLRAGDPVRILPPPSLSNEPIRMGGRLAKVEQRAPSAPVTIRLQYPAGPMAFDGDGRARGTSARGWRIHPDDLVRIELPIRPVVVREATFSDDGRYRYTLTRAFVPVAQASIHALVVMLNPSVADGSEDDPTIRKLVAIARHQKWDAFTVVNLFARVATSPKDLRAEAKEGLDVIGPENDATIRQTFEYLRQKHTIDCVVGWGASVNLGPKSRTPVFRGRGEHVLAILREVYPHVRAFRITAKGAPEHPLFLCHDIDLVLYP